MASTKLQLRLRRKRRVRSQIHGTSQKPRLSVFRSLRGFSAQLIDDDAGKTIASAMTKEGNKEGTKKAAADLAKKYTGLCVFDRNGFAYQGRVKAFAESARENGLQF